MKSSICFSFLMGLLVFATGCAGVEFKETRVKKVKKVAILGIEVQQEQPRDALGLSSLKALAKNGLDQPDAIDLAEAITKKLKAQLKKKVSWQIIDLSELKTNSEYQKVVSEKMTGLRTTMPLPQGYERYNFKGILDEAAVRSLTHSQKLKMAKQLGADSYASLFVSVNIDQGFALGNLTGDADFSSQATIQFNVFDGSGEDPILKVQNFVGAQTSSSGKLAKSFTKQKKLKFLASEAAESAIQKAVAEINL